jgi:hypothetical protein
VRNDALKLLPEERRQLAARQDERLEAMRDAAGDELFLADLTATMEDFSHADQDVQPA